MKNRMTQLVEFALDEQRYAIYLSAVSRVVRAVEWTPLPKMPAIVLGVVNVEGEVIPLVDIRKRFRLPERNVKPSDQFVIALTPRRMVALIADSVMRVVEIAEERIVKPEHVLPTMEYVGGIMKLDDGLVVIHDLDKFLSLEEEQAIQKALKS